MPKEKNLEELDKSALVVASIVVLLILLVGGVFILWPIFFDWISPGNASDRIDLVTAIAQVVGGIALLVTLFFTYQGLKHTQTTVKIAHETFKSGQSSQYSDRYFRAVEQLGNDSSHIRIAAIYALDHLAKESDEHYGQVIDVLLRFVRDNTSKSTTIDNENPISGDIQVAITTLCRRRGIGPQFARAPLDFSNLKLKGADFTQGWLEECSFRGSILDGSYFVGALLCDAQFHAATCSFCHFQNAELQGAKFNSASLDHAEFSTEVDEKTINQELEGAYVEFDALPTPSVKSFPEWVEVERVRKERGTRLNQTDFWGADLFEAYLTGLDLSRTKSLYLEQLQEAFYDASATILPPELPPFDQWKMANAQREESAKSRVRKSASTIVSPPDPYDPPPLPEEN